LPNPKQIRQIKYLIFLLLATIMFFLSTSPAVMAQDELTLSVKVGLDSFAKESMTVPIQVNHASKFLFISLYKVILVL